MKLNSDVYEFMRDTNNMLKEFYRVVVQALLLFGAEIWVLMAEMSQKLGHTCRLPAAVDREEDANARGRFLDEGGCRQLGSRGGEITTPDLH